MSLIALLLKEWYCPSCQRCYFVTNDDKEVYYVKFGDKRFSKPDIIYFATICPPCNRANIHE